MLICRISNPFPYFLDQLAKIEHLPGHAGQVGGCWRAGGGSGERWISPAYASWGEWTNGHGSCVRKHCYIATCQQRGFPSTPFAEVFHPWVRWEGPGSGFESSSAALAPAAPGNEGIWPLWN